MIINKTDIENFVASYDAIQHLSFEDLLDDEEKVVIEHNLLFNIIKYFRLVVDKSED